MKKLLSVFLLLPLFTFSQSVVGTWTNSRQATDGLVFRPDSTVGLVDLATGKSNLRNISIKYFLTEASGEKFMEQQVYDKENKLVATKKFRYKISGDSLFMPRITESNGVERVKEFRDIYTRVK